MSQHSKRRKTSEQKYIVTKDDKINSFEHFISLLNKEPNIKNFCDSLTDSPVHEQIKYVFAKNHMSGKFIRDTCEFTLKEIFTNEISDFTIKFPNNSISCIKYFLKQIPFFEMIFDEFNGLEEVELKEDYDIVKIIIMMFYKLDISELINVQNICALLKLMDKWLINTNQMDLNFLFPFLDININKIIEYYITDNFDELITLSNYLTNIKGEDENWSIYATKFHNYDFKEKTFMFNNWSNKFSDEYKLKTINYTKNYELLNVANIEPKNVIEFLENSDLVVACDIFAIVTKEKVKIGFGSIVNYNNEKIIVLINSYYPYFDAIIFTKIIGFVPSNDTYEIFINNCKLSVGNKIIAGNDINFICNNTKDKCVLINSIHCILGENMYETQIIRYHPKCKYTISYSGHVELKSSLWHVEEVHHKMTI